MIYSSCIGVIGMGDGMKNVGLCAETFAFGALVGIRWAYGLYPPVAGAAPNRNRFPAGGAAGPLTGVPDAPGWGKCNFGGGSTALTCSPAGLLVSLQLFVSLSHTIVGTLSSGKCTCPLRLKKLRNVPNRPGFLRTFSASFAAVFLSLVRAAAGGGSSSNAVGSWYFGFDSSLGWLDDGSSSDSDGTSDWASPPELRKYGAFPVFKSPGVVGWARNESATTDCDKKLLGPAMENGDMNREFGRMASAAGAWYIIMGAGGAVDDSMDWFSSFSSTEFRGERLVFWTFDSMELRGKSFWCDEEWMGSVGMEWEGWGPLTAMTDGRDSEGRRDAAAYWAKSSVE